MTRMTLRTRVLVALSIVAVALIGAAVLVTRLTESNLVGQVDDELRQTASSAGGELNPGPHGDPDDASYSTFYVYAISPGGEQTLLAVPGALGDAAAEPDLRADDAL